MSKKLIAMILVPFIIAALVLPVYAEEETQSEASGETVEIYEQKFIEISTVDEFLMFAEACRLDSYSVGLVVTLKRDIDLSGTGFTGIPMFSGYFNGGGHEIRGIDLATDGS